ncbi:hypothetical protein LCGC14_0842360 [marine sediment metagenome]|uniref:Uncharacterized protein n=1 Tax=marine sediment metagenome TaxID=412755 RepID=A0A0F9PXZ6_9ZZZZ
MKVETTVEKALMIALATRMAPGNVAQRVIRKEARERIASQTEHAVDKAGIKLLEGGGFSLPKDISEVKRCYPVMLELTLEQILEIGDAVDMAVWGALRERQEDTLLELPDDLISWTAQARVQQTLSRIPKDERRAALKALEGDDDSE